MPRWLPFANVFSVGDLLIGAGIALVIVLAMRSARGPDARGAPMPPRPTPAATPSARCAART